MDGKSQFHAKLEKLNGLGFHAHVFTSGTIAAKL
jgi:hypothetical protein